ncbi:MAG: 60S ribosomal export protein NMD3 [Acidilobaceae archaeon]
MSRMCPRCGRERVQFVGSLCSDCYVQVKGVCEIQSLVEFVYCPSCGNYRAQGEWVEGRESLEDALVEFLQLFLLNKLKPAPEVEEVWISRIELASPISSRGLVDAKLEVSGRAGFAVMTESKSVKVKVEPRLCPICFKRKTKSGYRGVVQIRTFTNRLSKNTELAIGKVMEEIEPKVASAIIAVEKNKHGIDLLVSDHSVARLIAEKVKSKLGAIVKESYKIVGVDSRGRRQSILSISVRVPDFSSGDVVVLKNKRWRVLAINFDRAVLEDFQTNEITEVSLEELAKARRTS